MSTDTYDPWEHARDERPFSNGTEGYAWMDNWCFRPCAVDAAWQRYDNDKGPKADGCPLIVIALNGKTPAEWIEQPRDEQGRMTLGDQYHCMNFRAEGDDPPGPRREPDPMPGQSEMFDPEPLRRPGRMFADTVAEVPAYLGEGA